MDLHRIYNHTLAGAVRGLYSDKIHEDGLRDSRWDALWQYGKPYGAELRQRYVEQRRTLRCLHHSLSDEHVCQSHHSANNPARSMWIIKHISYQKLMNSLHRFFQTNNYFLLGISTIYCL